MISGTGVYSEIRQSQQAKHKANTEQEEKAYSLQLEERQDLRGLGFTNEYIGGLGENPLLKHHYNEGQKYREEGKFKEAIKEFKKCLSHPKATVENKVASNLLIGHCCHDLPDLKEAEKFYREALKISNDIMEEKEKANVRVVALSNIGLIFNTKRNYQEALKYCNDALDAAKQAPDKVGEYACYINLGGTYGNLKDYKNSIEHYEKSLEVAKELNNKLMESLCYGYIGFAYAHSRDFNLAIEYFLKEAEILKEKGQIHELKTVYRNLSLVYKLVGDPREAEKYRKLSGG